jgi:hypothetical protein
VDRDFDDDDDDDEWCWVFDEWEWVGSLVDFKYIKREKGIS